MQNREAYRAYAIAQVDVEKKKVLLIRFHSLFGKSY